MLIRSNKVKDKTDYTGAGMTYFSIQLSKSNMIVSSSASYTYTHVVVV